MRKKIILVSRCAWTLYNFRSGLLKYLKQIGLIVQGGGAAGDGFDPYITNLGVNFKALPIDKKSLNPIADFRLLLALYLWYRRERPDVVHHFTIKPVIYGSIAAWLAGVPRIINTITGLGYVFTNSKAVHLRQLVEWMYRIALRRAHWIFFQNNDDFSYFKDKKIIDVYRSSVLPGSGVDCAHFSTVSDYRPNECLTFLMISRLIADKGVYEFVAAAELLKSRFPNVAFQLLGGRDERNPKVISQSVIDQWEKKGVVHWLGEVADVRPIIRQADVVVLPSYYREGVPRSLLEAAAMGKAIVTTDAVGCRDAVDHGVTGFIVPTRDPSALAEAMSRFIGEPKLRQRMGANGRDKVIREFNEKDVIQKTVRRYGLRLSTNGLL